ncbi:MAG: copper resistance protein CopC [Gemmatimonadaceae bacterium]
MIASARACSSATRRRVTAGVLRASLVVATCLGLILGTPVLAWAHATLVTAEPAVGGRVSVSPMHIRLVFSEELEANLGRISVVGSDGKVIVLSVSGDPHDVNALMAPVHVTLAAGAYRVMWRIVSADGHPVDGSFVFSVGDGAAARADTVGPPVPVGGIGDANASANWGPNIAGAPALPSLLRGLAVGTLMAAAGLLLFITWTDRGNESATLGAARLARALTVAFVVLLPLHLLAWAMNASPEHQMSGEMLSSTMSSGVGRLELWRTGLALVGALLFLVARRPRIALVFAFLSLLVSGATGHSSALSPLWTTPAKALHLVAGAVWLGGLLWLITFDRAVPERFEREALRVSSVALICVIIVTLSGAIQTFLFLPKLGDLFTSAYGAVSLAKVAGLLVLVAFGAHHKLKVLPRLRQEPGVAGRFSVTLRREVFVMTVVVLLGGLLGYLPPPDATHSTQSHDPTSHTLDQ